MSKGSRYCAERKKEEGASQLPGTCGGGGPLVWLYQCLVVAIGDGHDTCAVHDMMPVRRGNKGGP
jgi:hypothetical protein